MKSSIKYFSIALIVAATAMLHACKPDKNFPDEPIIQFEDIIKVKGQNGKDTISIVRISFTDGDGDLGLSQSDTFPPFDTVPYSSNYFAAYFEKQNGVFVEVNLPIPITARIPDLTPVGKNKAIEGDIDMNMQLKPGAVFDTIRYEIYIVDRTLNHSNTVTTSEIVINTQ